MPEVPRRDDENRGGKMVLRLPSTLIDTSLLEDEPFHSAFSSETKRTRRARHRGVASVLDAMRVEERGVRVLLPIPYFLRS